MKYRGLTYNREKESYEWVYGMPSYGYELPFERYVPTVLDILSKADKVIAYNAAFEDSYLKAYGIEVDPEKWIDPMIMFAEIYGEWNERRGSYKWQSLTKCATYYGYEFKAHDSLKAKKPLTGCLKQ